MAPQGRRPPRRTQKQTRTPRPRPAASAQTPKRAVRPVAAPAPAEEPRTFRLGVVPGATPGTWIDRWKQRMPLVTLELVPIEVAEQRRALDEVDAALVRLPLADDALHLIPLYEEVPVVIAGTDSHLLAADELTVADLAGEVVLTLSDDPFTGYTVPGAVAPTFAALSVADAVPTVAAGVGAVVVPMSVARLHQRKDADQRPLLDGPRSTVALAWVRDRTTPDVETFVGIVRGRTANSSR